MAPGEELLIEVQDAFGGERDIRKVPDPFTAEWEGHPTPPATGPVYVEGAEPGHTLVVDILEIRPGPEGVVAIQRNAGFLPDRFPTPRMKRVPIKDGAVHFDGVRIPLYPNFGTFSTTPATGGRAGIAGFHGGDLDQKPIAPGHRVFLPVFVPGALFGLGDPHAVISDGIACGTGVECAATARLRFDLRRRPIARPRIETPEGAATSSASGRTSIPRRGTPSSRGSPTSRASAGWTRRTPTCCCRWSGDLVIGTSPRPIMGVRVVLPRAVLAQLAGGDPEGADPG